MQTINAQVFHSEQKLGTSACIIPNAESMTEEQMLSFAQSRDTAASVFITQTKPHPHIKIFNHSNAIQWCGHGLLAVTNYLKQFYDFSKIQLPAGSVNIFNDSEFDWIGFDLLYIEFNPKNTSKKDRLAELISHEIIGYATVGAQDGYLILELESTINLHELSFDIETLKAITTRALILTQEANSDSKFDYKFRYFAPHYGVNEDPATGSANRVLTQYWQAKLNKTSFTAEQASVSGAVIFSKVHSNRVWISGKVELS